MQRFEGKSVLVTGATRGIGRACAEAFLAEGAQVAVNGRTIASVDRAMVGLGDGAVPAPGDVSTAAGCAINYFSILHIYSHLLTFFQHNIHKYHHHDQMGLLPSLFH